MTARIVTFYSYKGGVGRSMALANVAWILASSGRRVLAVDWDLDAPGLHRYFRPFLLDPDLAQSPGLIDFLIESATGSVTGATGNTSLLSYASSLEWKFPAGGRLDLVGAGRQDRTYALRAGGFDWHAFYERLGGQELLERMKHDLDEYDFVLIDSRTGLSDMSAVCIEQMPERLVLCFGPYLQSIDGSLAAAQRSWFIRANPLEIIAVLMRVDHGEKELLEQTRRTVRSKLFSPGFAAGVCVEFPYVPYYAYKEILSVFIDAPFSRGTVRMAAEDLADRLAPDTVRLDPEIPDDLRRKVLMAYDSGTTLVGGMR
jgi:MinD-like ATPase involved in chromosome partitioning or flagellar assembly